MSETVENDAQSYCPRVASKKTVFLMDDVWW